MSYEVTQGREGQLMMIGRAILSDAGLSVSHQESMACLLRQGDQTIVKSDPRIKRSTTVHVDVRRSVN